MPRIVAIRYAWRDTPIEGPPPFREQMSRIVLSPSAYLPTLGGVQELTRHLALTLAATGDEVEVWWMQECDVSRPSVETIDGLTVRRFPFPLPSGRPVLDAAGPDRLRPDPARHAARGQTVPARRHQCAVLWAQWGVHDGALAPDGSAVSGHAAGRNGHGRPRHLREVDDAADCSSAGYQAGQAVTGCSAFTLHDSQQRFGLAPGRGEVIFNGVDLDEQPAATSPVVDDLGRYVVALGRVVEKKGFDLLIRAFARIASTHPDVSLAIGGDGDQLPNLRTLVAELGLGRQVRFIGRLDRDQVAAVMAGAEVFVMPSRLEPFGIVTLEAWRAGCPVIASSRGGAPEFVEDGRTGLLVDPFDDIALGDALDSVLGNESLRTALREAASARVRDFSWPTIAESYRSIFRASKR